MKIVLLLSIFLISSNNISGQTLNRLNDEIDSLKSIISKIDYEINDLNKLKIKIREKISSINQVKNKLETEKNYTESFPIIINYRGAYFEISRMEMK